MEDFYIEQIVKKKDSKLCGIIEPAIIVVSIAIFILGAMKINAILMLLGILVGVLSFYFLIPLLYVEYEYLYMARELTIDKIYNKENRKRVGTWDLSNMELFAPTQSAHLKEYDNRKSTMLDFTSKESNTQVYEIILNDKKLTRIAFEPNEEIIKAIRSQFPRQSKEY